MAQEDEDVCSWTELLPSHPLFEELKESPCKPLEDGNVLCEIRGDLFAWCQAKSAMLTTNLKRLMAYPRNPAYQVRMHTRTHTHTHTINHDLCKPTHTI